MFFASESNVNKGKEYFSLLAENFEKREIQRNFRFFEIDAAVYFISIAVEKFHGTRS